MSCITCFHFSPGQHIKLLKVYLKHTFLMIFIIDSDFQKKVEKLTRIHGKGRVETFSESVFSSILTMWV